MSRAPDERAERRLTAIKSAQCPARHAPARGVEPGFRVRAERAIEASVDVVAVRSGADRRAFLRVPWVTQGDDPAWIPPLLLERAAFVDARHPFLAHGEAELFLARQKGTPAGRVLVSCDPRYDARHGERAAFFGMFESVPGGRVAHALLDAAADWAVARGKERLGRFDATVLPGRPSRKCE